MNKYECSVVVPIYKSDLTCSSIYAIRRNWQILGDRHFYFVCPRKLESQIDKIFDLIGFEARVKFFDNRFFESVDSYNRLMVLEEFYSSFSGYRYILVAQDDALVLSDKLSFWCDKSYSYIGAPWFVGFSEPKRPLEFYGVGNGGFSLRNVNDHVQFLSRPRIISYPDDAHFPKHVASFLPNLKNFVKRNVCRFNIRGLFPRVNEDVFWGVLAPLSASWFTVPNPREALDFAFEVSPAECFRANDYKLPFGCHAWERYDRQFWVEKLDIDIERDIMESK